MSSPVRPILMLVAATAAPAMLGGCNDTARYPSLALRPIETTSLAEPVARPVPAGTAATAADVRYAPLVARAQSGDDAFRRAFDAARPVLARGRGAAIGSDAWTAAQVALSRLQAARAPVTEALLSLQAAGEAPETHADSGLAAAATRALATVVAIDQRESRALAEAAPAAD